MTGGRDEAVALEALNEPVNIKTRNVCVLYDGEPSIDLVADISEIKDYNINFMHTNGTASLFY